MSSLETAAYNAMIDKWGFKTRNMLKSSISRLSMKGKKELVRSLQYKTKKDFGETEAVIYNFAPHGVFFHKGVGRGYIMMAGKVVRGRRKESKGKSANTPQNSILSAATGPLKRKPKDWFNPIFTKSIPVLADLIAQTKADHIFEVKNIKMNT
jgi:hypothetical protein